MILYAGTWEFMVILIIWIDIITIGYLIQLSALYIRLLSGSGANHARWGGDTEQDWGW